MKFLKIRHVKSPTRNYGDAGIDFYVPEFSEEFIEATMKVNKEFYCNEKWIVVRPYCDVLIPSGIKSKFDANIALEAANKSGVCTKQKLIVGASVVDSSYQGEIHLHVINTSKENVYIYFGQKLMQFIPRLIDTSEIEITTVEDGFYDKETERGTGGFGSTGV